MAALACGLLLWSAAACAATVRHLFEPMLMEFEESGVMELDVQFGVVRGKPGVAQPSGSYQIGEVQARS